MDTDWEEAKEMATERAKWCQRVASTKMPVELRRKV